MAQVPKPAHEADVADWVARVKGVVEKPDKFMAAAPEEAQPWHNRLFGCFDPIDTCLVTWCCPCVTFGKTHHRTRKDHSLAGYSPINASCLGWMVASCFGCHWVPQILQRHEIREKNNLTGDCVTDCLRAWCCACCDLVQQDKEAEYRALNQVDVTEGYQKQAGGLEYRPGA